jgi:site-specific DNA recombinase
VNVAVYIRWSTDDQADGTTLAVQREACRHFILSQGWRFTEELLFVDDGFSGGTLQRPALTRLRALCREGAVDCVVVYKLDRLSRSVVDTVKLVMDEWEGRVALKSAREAVDTASPMGRQLFYLLVSYAEWERNVIRERTAAGKWKRAQEGRNPGFVAPYGYRNAGTGRLALEPRESPVVQRIFAEAGAGRSAHQIADGLNAEAIPSRTGARWSAPVIAKLLRNSAYTGLLAYGRTTAAAGGRRIRREAGGVAVPDALPRLIRQEDFDRIQARRSMRRPAPRAAAGDALLTGLATCGACGRALTSHQRLGRRYRYYACTGCPTGFIPREGLEAEVVRQIQTFYRPPDWQTALNQGLKRESTRLKAALRQAEQRLAALDRRERRARDAFSAGEIDGRRLTDLLADAAAERQRIAAEIGRQRQELRLHQTQIDWQRQIDLWAPLTPAEQKAVLRTLLTEARLTKSTLDLTWRVP